MRLSDFRPNMALMSAPMNYVIVFLMVAIAMFAFEIVSSQFVTSDDQ